MSVSLPFIIRDGHEADIQPALQLDHQYESDFVWQVQVERDELQFCQMTFRAERLPRTLVATCPASEARIQVARRSEHCFLVAAERDGNSILAYLCMMSNPAHKVAHITDLIVDRAYRRMRIGSKLLNVARRWAKEHGHERLQVEMQTRNYPAISFCQASGLTFCGYNERYFEQQEIAVFFGQPLR
jgi:ribosomal protein S18 acetylase RimI-like enzyme